LDEVQIEKILKSKNQYGAIVKRKQSILDSIEEQGALTPALKEKLEQSFDMAEIEDLYLPFKKKRKTKADIDRENGLEPLAKMLLSQNIQGIEEAALRFVSSKVATTADALQGARDIIAEWINENMYVRKVLRRKFQKTAIISSKVVKSKKEEEGALKFEQYFDWNENLNRAAAHRVLAILRAYNEGYVKVDVTIDKDEAIEFIAQTLIKNSSHE